MFLVDYYRQMASVRVTMAVCATLTNAAVCAGFVPLPPTGGNALLPENAVASLALLQRHGDDAILRVESLDPGEPFSTQAVVEMDPLSGLVGEVAVAVELEAGAMRGDVMLLRMWLRAVGGVGQATVVVRPEDIKQVPSTATAWQTDRSGWHCVSVPFVAKTQLPESTARVELQCTSSQVLAIGGLGLTNYGKDRSLTQLIGEIGRGEILVEVTDAQNRSIANAKVAIEMTHTAFGFPVKVNEPMYESISVSRGPYGAPHLVALKPLVGQEVMLSDLPAHAVVRDLLPGQSRHKGGQDLISGVPKILRQLRSVTIERGAREHPSGGFSFAVDRPVQAYLFVQDRGHCSIDNTWHRTPMSASWTSSNWHFTDRIFQRRFNAGQIEVPTHDGSTQPQWWTRHNGRTNVTGMFSVSGYFGEYCVRVVVAGEVRTVDAELNSSHVVVSVQMD